VTKMTSSRHSLLDENASNFTPQSCACCVDNNEFVIIRDNELDRWRRRRRRQRPQRRL